MDNQEDNGPNWEQRYRNLKKKLAELQNIRIDSVKQDTDDLRQKIEEHRKVHEISVKELKQQNAELAETIENLNFEKNNLVSLKAENNRIRELAYRYDGILRYFLGDPDANVVCVGSHKFKITYLYKNTEVIYTIENITQFKGSGEYKYRYEPVSIPNSHKQKLNEILFFNDLNVLKDMIKNPPQAY